MMGSERGKNPEEARQEENKTRESERACTRDQRLAEIQPGLAKGTGCQQINFIRGFKRQLDSVAHAFHPGPLKAEAVSSP